MKSSPPSIAVAIPTMNRPDLLRQALDSVARQTRLPDEIFIGDNSKQSDELILKEYPHLPIRYVHKSEKIGVEAAFDWVFREPTSDYVALLEDDNLFRADHLHHLERAILKYPNAGIFSTAAKTYYETRGPLQSSVFAPPLLFDLLRDDPEIIPREVILGAFLFGTPVAASALALNSAVHKKVNPIQTGFRGPQDRWRWVQLLVASDLVFVPVETALFRDHPLMISKDIPRQQHHYEGRWVTRSMRELMQKHHFDWKVCCDRFLAHSPQRMRSAIAADCFRQRDWKFVSYALPKIFDCSLPKASALTAAALLARKLKISRT